MRKNENGIIRVEKDRDNPYTMINTSYLSEKGMSWKAKGILTYLLSKPDNWQVQVKDLMNQSTDGRDAVYTGLNELKRFGYLQRFPVKEKGKVIRWDSIVFEKPHTEKPDMAAGQSKKPHTEKPDLEKPDTAKPEHNYIDPNYDPDQLTLPSFLPEGKNEIADFFKLPEYKRDDVGVAVLIDQVELEHAGLDRIYPGLKDAVRNTLDEMYRAPHVNVKGSQVPQEQVRSRLAKLSPDGLKHAVVAFIEACRTRTVLNPSRYLQSAIFEAQAMITLKDAADFQRLERFTE